ncbi:MAG: hypothetical protein JW804_05190 [Sedimentisphaerales bacterium]|nr:hypothetical protein [Sedimentisphaerales bacterium]
MVFSEKEQVEYKGPDILSYKRRKNSVHILTVDKILADDIYERIHDDFRMDHYTLIKPEKASIREASEEIEKMATDTVSSRVLVIDVRKSTLPRLQQAYNKVVGYNRKDLNKLCFIILIGDGPVGLFEQNDDLDRFVTYLSIHRVDYSQAAFFFDPFIHYESQEEGNLRVDSKLTLKDKVPQRLVPYFTNQDEISVRDVRKFFRAMGMDKEVKEKRAKILTDLYTKRIAEQFPSYKDKTEVLLSGEGLRLATEKLHIYPLFFEDWVYELVQKAAQGRENAD